MGDGIDSHRIRRVNNTTEKEKGTIGRNLRPPNGLKRRRVCAGFGISSMDIMVSFVAS